MECEHGKLGHCQSCEVKMLNYVIEELEESLHIARVGRRDLINYVKQLEKEIKQLKEDVEFWEDLSESCECNN